MEWCVDSRQCLSIVKIHGLLRIVFSLEFISSQNKPIITDVQSIRLHQPPANRSVNTSIAWPFSLKWSNEKQKGSFTLTWVAQCWVDDAWITDDFHFAVYKRFESRKDFDATTDRYLLNEIVTMETLITSVTLNPLECLNWKNIINDCTT